jgi:hypothetical protein
MLQVVPLTVYLSRLTSHVSRLPGRCSNSPSSKALDFFSARPPTVVLFLQLSKSSQFTHSEAGLNLLSTPHLRYSIYSSEVFNLIEHPIYPAHGMEKTRVSIKSSFQPPDDTVACWVEQMVRQWNLGIMILGANDRAKKG